MTGLLAPPAQLPPHLQRFRVWIWLQLVMLRLYVRAVKGAQASFLTGIDRNGNVHIVAIGDTLAERRAAPWSFTPSKAFRMAMSEDEDVAVGICSPRPKTKPGIDFMVPSIPNPGLSRNEQNTANLPLPET